MVTKIKHKFSFSIHFLLLIITFISLAPYSLQHPQLQWQLLGLENEDIEDIVISQTKSQIIYAGSSSISPGSNGGFYKSTNAGTTWDTIINGNTVSKIVIHPSNEDIIYLIGAVTVDISGVIKTTNGGNTWFNAD